MKGFRNHQKFLPERVFSRVVPGIMRGVYLVHFEQGYPGMYKLSDAGAEVLLVSSGSIALGRGILGLPGGPLKLEESQAAAKAHLLENRS